MLPLVVASVLNATSAANVASREDIIQTTEPPMTTCPEDLMVLWASANPDDCMIKEESGPMPEVGDTGCAASHAEGAIAWGVERFCDNRADWVLVCVEDTWLFRGRNRRMDYFVGEHDPNWIAVKPTSFHNPKRTWSGFYNAVFVLNNFCSEDAPSTFRNAGSLYICVNALAKGKFVATICNRGDDPEHPACATDPVANSLNYDMVGSEDCPLPGMVG